MSESVGNLESAALKRKAKLAELRAKKAKASGGDGSDKEKKDTELPAPVFRSYKPYNKDFEDHTLPEAELREVKEFVKEDLEKEHLGVEIDQLDFTNLAPRKPDWDLKRDIAPKLEKLEKRTQIAIAELIRERLRGEDLANAVNAGANAARKEAESDED